MRLLFAACFCVMLAGAACAERTVEWSELIDQAVQEYEDPFVDLTYDQIDILRDIVENGQRLKSVTLDEVDRVNLEERLVQDKRALADEGIDADWLISQRWLVADRRERAATSGNPAVDGQIIRLAGFAIPAPPEEDGTSVVYLVPERGMCSHVPPPPPNQMVRVRVTGGWQPNTMHEPVRLTGRISIDPTKHRFEVVDGLVPMNATFLMQADDVETVQQLRALGDQNAATNEWASGIAERLRSSGQLPHSPTTATE